MAESNSNFTIDDLMNSRSVNMILDSNPDNFVKVSASYLGDNALQVGISVNCRTVSTQTYILDARGQFNLANMVQIERSDLTLNRRQIDIIYNRAVVYSYSYCQPRQPSDPSSSDSDSEEKPAAAASPADAGASAAPADVGGASTASAGGAAAPAPADAGT